MKSLILIILTIGLASANSFWKVSRFIKDPTSVIKCEEQEAVDSGIKPPLQSPIQMIEGKINEEEAFSLLTKDDFDKFSIYPKMRLSGECPLVTGKSASPCELLKEEIENSSYTRVIFSYQEQDKWQHCYFLVDGQTVEDTVSVIWLFRIEDNDDIDKRNQRANSGEDKGFNFISTHILSKEYFKDFITKRTE